MDGTIIIMDYSSYERQRIRHIIEKTGNFSIVEVGSYNQFILLDINIDDLKLIIMDLSFPTEKEGFEALERIRSSENRHVPVIIVTRSDKRENKVEALKYAVSDYILKPYQIKRLENSIRSVVHIIRDFYYDASGISDIQMSFENFVKREIKLSKRSQKPLSIILITVLQPDNPQDNSQEQDSKKLALFSMAVEKAGESIRATDTLVTNMNRDIIIILPCTDEAGAKMVCQKIEKKLEPEIKNIDAGSNEYIYSAHVTFPIDGDSFLMLMEKAFKKISDKEMLEKIISIPQEKRNYADRSYSRFKKWL